MKTPPPARIIVSTELTPAFNLAAEEWLLRARSGREHILFVYRNSAAIVVGRNQNPWIECDVGRCRAAGIDIARRVSGGGTVYHDPGNTNFSFIMPRDAYEPERFVGIASRALAETGVANTHNSRRDLLVNGRKVSGTAFMLTGKSALQHGTLLWGAELTRLRACLRVDATDIEARAVRSVPAAVANASGVDHPRFQERLASVWCNVLGLEADWAELGAGACGVYEALGECVRKHASWEWVFGRTPPFTRVMRAAVGGAECQIRLAIARGEVSEVAVAAAGAPAWARQLADELRPALAGLRYGEPLLTSTLHRLVEHQSPLLAAAVRRLAESTAPSQ